MADDKERLVELVRSARFDAEGMCDEHENCMFCPAGYANGGKCVDGYIADQLMANRVTVIPETGIGDMSDGYHTFNELYHHRAMLFSVICNTMPERAWKSKQHHDGTMYEGMFIIGIDTPEGQATYHYDIDPYWDVFDVKELEQAPTWDGHTPDVAIRRIAMLAPSRVPIRWPRTNSDHFRGMTDKQLADAIYDLYIGLGNGSINDISEFFCDGKANCITKTGNIRCSEKKARACVLRWLQREYEEDEG